MPIVWARRRDQHIVKYLLLQPDGAATRTHLAEVFCPATARPQAMQNLRTACSTIRRAIAACVGTEYLDAYFHTAGDAVTLRPENTINALAAFDEHLESAREARERGDLPAARRHFEAALRLNDRPLLSGEAPAPWIADRAHVCDERAEDARASLRAIEP